MGGFTTHLTHEFSGGATALWRIGGLELWRVPKLGQAPNRAFVTWRRQGAMEE